MSVVLYIVGAIAVMIGVAMVGYGIPINEFSFGNTLIVAGTTAAIGGLIVGALGVAVAHLQRMMELLGGRAGEQPEVSLDTFEPPPERRPVTPPGRIPFPPRRPEPERPVERPAVAAPVLRNPEISVVEEYKETFLADEGPLPPPEEMERPMPPPPPPRTNRAGAAAPELELDAPWRASTPPPPQPSAEAPPPPAQPRPSPARPPRTSYFDNMWPANEPKAAKGPAGSGPRPESLELPPRESPAPEMPKPHAEAEPRPVAILKSGVIDGMGYTLYVDGSIEAELPQGTLRFSSINELRDHLSKNA
jgi:hypothetical protein